MTNAEHDKDMIESIEMWLHEIEPKWVENELAWLDELRTRLLEEKSEKPMNPEEAMKELNEKIALVKQRGTWDGVDVDKYMDEVRGREPEKPMEQDGLEEELDRFITSGKSVTVDDYGTYKVSYHDFKKVARHFAEWGYLRAAEKYNEIEYNRQREEESVPNDLEEAANEYAYMGMPDEMKSYVKSIGDEVIKNFIAGAKWDRSQMMKEAEEGEYGYFSSTSKTILPSGKLNLKEGDKIRIIVCKNED